MGYEQLVDCTLVVNVPNKVQLERTAARDKVAMDQIEEIIASQMLGDQRLAKADDIIDNSGSIENTRTQVLALHEKYLLLSKA